MVLFIWKLDSSGRFQPDSVIDTASSVIWCERYQEAGEFELFMRATPELLRYFTDNELLITRTVTSTVMVPERVEITTSSENGDYLRVTGYSAEGVTRRRIIQQDVSMTGFDTGAELLYYLLRENIGSYWYYHADAQHPESKQYRFIPFLHEGNVVSLPDSIEIKAQPFGENLGDFIETVCKACGDGFRVRMGSNGDLYYELYRGADRTGSVIFAKDFQNLGDTTYSIDRRTYFNEVMVAGDGDGKDRARQVRILHNSSKANGYTLREKFVDAHNVSRNTTDENGEEISVVVYNIMLAKMAITELEASKEEVKFDGDIVPGGQFYYRQNYFLGDKVTVRNAYGIQGTATVTEVTETEDASGFRVIPAFADWSV